MKCTICGETKNVTPNKNYGGNLCEICRRLWERAEKGKSAGRGVRMVPLRRTE